MSMLQNRVRVLKQVDKEVSLICYWMSRDQRIEDNWAFVYAYKKAIENKASLIIAFSYDKQQLTKNFLHLGFMLEGLKAVAMQANNLNVPFYLLDKSPEIGIADLCNKLKISHLITDFSPLKINQRWKNSLIKNLDISIEEVDAHNIIPVWQASPKQEYGAYTLRPKIYKLLNTYIEDFPKIHPYTNNRAHKNHLVFPITPNTSQIKAGTQQASKVFNYFISNNLKNYQENRNHPDLNTQSNLSPYLHFGQISAQKIIQEALSLEQNLNTESFIEECLVRRELADNYCFYNKNYDNFEGFPNWAQKTLNTHREDIREYIYTINDLENAKTHDVLWNSCQTQLTTKYTIHGYMRMYWAKKILEWTRSPEEAQKIAIYLNDKYQLDGRDPNGYTGIAWSIGGVHDRAWFDRPIFGLVRYMSANSLIKKIKVKEYIKKFTK